MITERQVLTNSSLSTFRSCPRKYQIQYELGYVPVKENENLTFGKLMHKGIEAWSKNRNIGEAVDAIYQMANQSQMPDEYMVAKVHALMEGYGNQYQFEPYEIVGAEMEGRAPLLNPDTARESQTFQIGFVIDSIIKDRKGRFLIKETKTTSENIENPAADYWFNLMIDSQISTYFLGAEALGYEISNCLYDVIRKPGIQPYKATPIEKRKFKKDGTLYADQREIAETPQEYYDRLKADIASRPSRYYARREVPRLPSDLEDYMFDTWGMSQTLRAYQIKGRWPRNVRSCIGLYGTCSYFGVCTGRASLDDTSLFKKKESKHQELTEVKK